MVRGPDDPRAIVLADYGKTAVFSVDGKSLFSSGLEKVIKIWDAATGEATGELTGHASPATHLVLSRDGKVLVSGTFEREIKIWDVATLKETASFDNGASVYGLAVSADGKRFLSCRGVDVLLWDVAQKGLVQQFKGGKGGVSGVTFSPDEKLVVAYALETMVWDAKTLELLTTFARPPSGFAITPDSRTLIMCDEKGNVKLHDLPRR